MAQPTSDRMSYLEPIKQSSPGIKEAIAQLSQVFPNEVINMRLVNWLWRFMVQRTNSEMLLAMNYNTMQGLIDLAKVIATSDSNEDYEKIRSIKNSTMVSSKCLEWILQEDNQKRLTSWLTIRKIEIGLSNLSDRFLQNENNTQDLITNIDCKQDDAIKKVTSIQLLESEWNKLKRDDKIFSWFEKEDTQSKLNTAHAWLCENIEKIKPSLAHITFQKTEPPFQEIGDLITYFDKITTNTPEKILYIERIKRRFNQAKYKESIKDKKQCNLVLKKIQ